MIKEFIPLTNDLLFKEAMAHIDNREALIDFLKCTTNINEEVIRNNLVVKYESVVDKTKIKDKSFRGDINIRFSNYYINLEGYSKFDKNSLAKSTSYIMRIFSTQLDRGERYDNLDSMIQINIIENDETGIFKDYINDEKTKKIFGMWGENIAHDKGYRKGKKEQAIEIAKTLKEKGFNTSDIIEITKLSKEEIDRL